MRDKDIYYAPSFSPDSAEKLSEGQTWRSEDAGVFSSKSFLTLGSPPLFADAVTHGTDSCRLLRGRNPLFSLRKVCSSLHDFSFNCGIRVHSI